MKLVCKSATIPAQTETRGLGFFKHEHVLSEEKVLPLTKGKSYNFTIDYVSSFGYNYVHTEIHLYIFTDNKKWEKLVFDTAHFSTISLLNYLFEDPE